MPVPVRELIDTENVLVIHCLAPNGALHIEKIIIEGKEKIVYARCGLTTRLRYIQGKINKNENFYLSCSTFNLGVDKAFCYNREKNESGHLFRNGGIIISGGSITHASVCDAGLSNDTQLNLYDRLLVNSVENIRANNVLNSNRDGHNELRIENPRAMGIFFFPLTGDFYELIDFEKASLIFNLPLYWLGENNKNDIRLINKQIDWQNFLKEFIN
ncbi:MAG: hypothetical protein PHN88_04630 [Ignavibacteria bacterium]|nr:hypothetical protein [Ignavibacteria bacterium]